MSNHNRCLSVVSSGRNSPRAGAERPTIKMSQSSDRNVDKLVRISTFFFAAITANYPVEQSSCQEI